MVEGDEETYSFERNVKGAHPENNVWIFLHPGGFHLMWHFGRSITSRFWGAGLELVANELGGDDRHAAPGRNYRRCHHSSR